MWEWILLEMHLSWNLVLLISLLISERCWIRKYIQERKALNEAKISTVVHLEDIPRSHKFELKIFWYSAFVYKIFWYSAFVYIPRDDGKYVMYARKFVECGDLLFMECMEIDSLGNVNVLHDVIII